MLKIKQLKPLAVGVVSVVMTNGILAATEAVTVTHQPVRLVVPFPAGGPTDIVARPLANLLGDKLKQQVFIDNKGGAGGSIAAADVAKAKADGQTLILGTVGTHAINKFLYKGLTYDPVSDFSPIALVASAPVVLVVPANSGFHTLSDFVHAAKAKPDTVSFASAGNGTPGHLTGELFASTAQVKLMHVPYKGSAPALQDLIGGQVPSAFDPIQSVLAHVKAGKLRALAISSKERSSVLPDVPTFQELGYTKFESTAWWAVFAPKGTPAATQQLLVEKVSEVVKSPTFSDKFAAIGVVSQYLAGADFVKFQNAELDKWGKAVKDADIKN